MVLDEIKEQKPASQPMMEGQLTAIGVETIDRTVVKLRPILPQNFLIDPVATSIEEAEGVIIEEFVSEHVVIQAQEAGIYRNVYVGRPLLTQNWNLIRTLLFITLKRLSSLSTTDWSPQAYLRMPMSTRT